MRGKGLGHAVRTTIATAALALVLVGVAEAAPNSQNVALVPSPIGSMFFGGVLPTSGFPGGYSPSFTNVTPESIRDDATDPLTAFDTVVLVGICDIDTFLANVQFKSRLENFVSNGGKLIIWDSECPSTDYSMFVYPFTTNNPGQLGAQGTLTDLEENSLSSTNTASPSYVDVAAVSTGTDAVGDANVFVTFNQNWCVDLRALNAAGVDGPVHTYARLGPGLIIYNGLDKDVLFDGIGFDPTSTSGNVHLARIWLLELLQPFNPDNLPCGVVSFGLALTPETASNPASTSHTVTAKATVNAVPQPGVTVTFTVTAGPNAGQTGTGTTDANGDATFTYTSNGAAGTDTIEASAVLPGPGGVPTPVSDTAEKTWTVLTEISINDTTVTEGNSGTTNATFTVSLSAASGTAVTVDFATADGTATTPSDYTSASGTLTFAPGETTKTITVLVNGDTLVEPDETFFVNLSNAVGATIADGQGQGTIVNDDLPPPVLDHFKCYKTKQLGTRFDPRQVVLADQFNTQRVNVVRPETFCNPVDKDGSGINNPTAHLTCYKIRDVRGDEFPKFTKQRVEVSDQFGTHTLLLKKIRTLCLPSSKSPAGEVPGPLPTGLDHFKCYKTKQLGTRFDPRRVILTDQFNKERVNVVRPEAFCTPVDKDGSGINDPTAHLACYKIRDVRGDEFPKFRKRPVEVGDQFGTHSLLLKKTRTLCLPSSKTVL